MTAGTFACPYCGHDKPHYHAIAICPACKGERRGPDGALCKRCKGAAQIARSELKPGEIGAFQGTTCQAERHAPNVWICNWCEEMWIPPGAPPADCIGRGEK